MTGALSHSAFIALDKWEGQQQYHVCIVSLQAVPYYMFWCTEGGFYVNYSYSLFSSASFSIHQALTEHLQQASYCSGESREQTLPLISESFPLRWSNRGGGVEKPSGGLGWQQQEYSFIEEAPAASCLFTTKPISFDLIFNGEQWVSGKISDKIPVACFKDP